MPSHVDLNELDDLLRTLGESTPPPAASIELRQEAPPPPLPALPATVEAARLVETPAAIQRMGELRDKFIDFSISLSQHPEGQEVVDAVKQSITDPSFFDKFVMGPALWARTLMMEAHSEGFLERPGEMLRSVENVPGFSLMTSGVSAPTVKFFDAPKQGIFSGSQSKGIIEEWMMRAIDTSRATADLPNVGEFVRGLKGLDEKKIAESVNIYQQLRQIKLGQDPSVSFAGAAQFTGEAALDLSLDPLMVFTSLPRVFFLTAAGSVLKPWQQIRVLSRAEFAAAKAAGESVKGIQIAGYGTFAEAAKKIAAGGWKSAEATLRLSLAPFPEKTRHGIIMALGDNIRRQRMTWARATRWVDSEAFNRLLPSTLRTQVQQLRHARVKADQDVIAITEFTKAHIFKNAGVGADKLTIKKREFITRLVDEGHLRPIDEITVTGQTASRQGILNDMEELVGAIREREKYTPPQAGMIQDILAFARSLDSTGKAVRFPEVSKMTNREILALAADGRRLQNATREVAVEEVKYGMLNSVRQVYMPHIFQNISKVREELQRHRVSYGQLSGRTVDDLALLRAMDPFLPFSIGRKSKIGSIAEAERRGFAPITDAAILFQRRQYHYLTNRNQQVFYREVLKTLGGEKYLEVADQVRKEFAAQSGWKTLTTPGVDKTLFMAPAKAGENVLAMDFAKGKPVFGAAVKEAAKSLGVQPNTLYLPEALAREFAGAMGRARTAAERSQLQNLLLGMWDGQMAFFKLMVTSPHPGFHITNISGDMLRAYQDAGAMVFNPVTWKQIESVLAGDPSKFIRIRGKMYSAAELKKLSNDLGTFKAKYDLSEALGASGLPEPGRSASDIGRSAGNVASFGLGYAGTAAGQMWEERMRRALFLTYMKKGFTPELAREEVYRVLFNVTSLSPTEKEVFRRAFPFYSFWKFNAEFQIKSLGYTPGKVAIFEKLAQAKAAGVDDRDWKDLVSVWDMQGTTMPTRTATGEIRITGFKNPTKEFWARLPKNFSAEEMRRVFLSDGMFNMAPVIKTGISLITQIDPVTGKEIGLRAYSQDFRLFEKAPQLLRDALGFNNTELDPGTGKVRYSINPYAYAAMQTMGYSRMVLGQGRMSRAGVMTPIDVVDDFKKWATGTPFAESYLTAPDIRKIDAFLSVYGGQATATLDDLEIAGRTAGKLRPHVEKLQKMKELLERQQKIGTPFR